MMFHDTSDQIYDKTIFSLCDVIYVQFVEDQNGSYSGKYDIYITDIDVKLTEQDEISVCQGNLIKHFFKYYYENASWPTQSDEFYQWFEKRVTEDIEKRNVFDPEAELLEYINPTIYSQIDRIVRLQKSVNSIAIKEIPHLLKTNIYYSEYYYDAYELLLDVFSLLPDLNNIEVCDNDYGIFSKNGILYRDNKDGITLIKCPPAYTVTDIHVDSSIVSIKTRAFFGTVCIVNVQIDNCNWIGSYAFYNSKALRKITIKSEHIQIDWAAFENCHSLKMFDVSIELIDYFCTCNSFDQGSIYEIIVSDWAQISGYTGEPENIREFGRFGNDVWGYSDKDRNDHMIGIGKMWDFCSELFLENNKCQKIVAPPFHGDNLIIHDGITSIGRCAFPSCHYESIKIGKDVKEVMEYAFLDGGCDKIEFVGPIEHIGTELFATDPCRVDKIVISTEIKQIDVGAFYWRLNGPQVIVLTGRKPPEDWIMWLRSDLFAWNRDMHTKIYYPEKWLDLFTHKYFEQLKKHIIEVEIKEDGVGISSFFDFDIEDRLNFVDDMENSILGKNSNQEDDRPTWIPMNENTNLSAILERME